MKTAMQLMIKYLEDEGLEDTGAYYKAKFLLDKEKIQIKTSYQLGVYEGALTDINYMSCEKEAEYYYNQSYQDK